MTYTPWPLMHTSAFVHSGEMLYSQLEAHWADGREVSKRLLLEMAAVMQRTQSHFLLAGIAEEARTGEMLAFARSEGLMALDISVNSNRPESRTCPMIPIPAGSRTPRMPSA